MQEPITYVGMDDHKDTIQAAIRSPGGGDMSLHTVANEPRALRRFAGDLVKGAPGPVMSCYEAGPNGYALQRCLERAGIGCQVVAPSLTPVRPGERVKTDRRDARKLAELLAAGLLIEVAPPTEAEEAVRDLCRCREAAQKDLTRCRHRLDKFLLRRGQIYRDGRAWTQKHRQWLWSLRLEPAADQLILEDCLLAVEQLETRLKELDRQLEAVAAEAPYRQPVGWLRCFRGIDTLSAMTLVTELHGVERFHSARQLMAYTGLTAREASTGKRQWRGRITKAGNAHLRRILVEAAQHYRHRPAVGRTLAKRRQGQPAWAISLADRAQKRLYHRYTHLLLSRSKSKGKVVVAMARELSGFVWATLVLGPRYGHTDDATH